MTNSTSAIKRGDIYYFDFGIREGSIQSVLRPVLVIQASDFNQSAPTIIVAAITSVNKKQYLPSHILLGENFGLTKPSMVLLEQLQTVNKADLVEYIGSMDDEIIWREINYALKCTFGMIRNRVRTADIRCLCPKCLADYFNNPAYIVRRVDPLKGVKDRCDKCNGSGYDYMIFDRNRR